MPITEGLMQVGSWSMELTDNAPTGIRRALRYGSNIFVTPTHVIDPGISITNLSAMSVFGGLTFRKGNQLRRFGGPGMLGYLQTGKGEAGGASTIAGPFPATFATILSQMLPGTGASNGIAVGTAYSPTATTSTLVANTYNPPKKPIIDTVAKQTGNEYRCRPNGTVDYGISTSLFRSTPRVAIAPGISGRDDTFVVLDTTSWEYDEDIDNYRNNAWVQSNNLLTNTTRTSGTPAGAVDFYRWNGGGASFVDYKTPIITADSNVLAELERIANAAGDEYYTPSYSIRAEVSDYCVPRFFVPGDWLYVYSADDDLKDAAIQVQFQGQSLNPKKMRCTGYTYPFEQGMGVYAYYYSSTGTGITDITRYVKWEPPGARIEIESKKPSVTGDRSRSIIE